MEVTIELTFNSLIKQDLTLTTKEVLNRIAAVGKCDDFMSWLEDIFAGVMPTLDDIDYYIEYNEDEVLEYFGLGEFDFLVDVNGLSVPIEFNWLDGDVTYKKPNSAIFEMGRWSVSKDDIIEAICEILEAEDLICTRIYERYSGEYVYENDED